MIIITPYFSDNEKIIQRNLVIESTENLDKSTGD